MGQDGTFDDRLRRFYESCSADEQDVIAYMAASALAVSDIAGQEVGGFTSDIGQKLQFALQEANNIYTRSTQAQSNIESKYNQTLNAIAQNLRG